MKTNEASTLDLMQRYVEAFNHHNIEAIIALLDEAVVHDINEGPSEIGITAFRNFKMRMDACYQEQLTHIHYFATGTHGAFECICEGTYLKTDTGLPEARGQQYAIPVAAFFETQQGKITRITSYYNLKGWIAAIS
jgi:steroid delta-isomerase-like uncharacterized protein